jgi:hypothetical protein
VALEKLAQEDVQAARAQLDNLVQRVIGEQVVLLALRDFQD